MAVFDDIVNRGKELFGLSQPAQVKKNDFEAFEIKEFIEVGRNPISLKLTGNMLPMVPFEWGSELRRSETYYPGNPEPTVQILGSKMGPLTIKGRFHDKRQPNGSAIAYSVHEVLETILARGNLLRLTLGNRWVRYGYLEQTKWMMKDLNSIEYNLTFFIVSENQPSQNPVLESRRNLPRDVNASLVAINAALKNNLLTYPSTYPKDIFDDINEAVSAVAEKIAIVTGVVDDIISAGERASSTLNRAYGLFAITKTFVYKADKRIGKLSLENEIRKKTLLESVDYGSVMTPFKGVPKQSITSGYKSVKSTQITQRQIHQSKILITQLFEQITAYIQTIPLARHLVKSGETLHTISTRYYSTPDYWQKIYTHNKLTSNSLEPGTLLEIPR